MNAKEKAEELVYKYEYLVIEYELKDMKQCALIAVDEILKAIGFSDNKFYWQEVKQEIEKL
jgi:hypothetical protein